jgi:hypothetical protein
MREEISRGLGRLGPVGSVETDQGLRLVQFEITFRYRSKESPAVSASPMNVECVNVWIASLNGKEISPSEYYLHAGYEEPIRLANESGDCEAFSWDS